jgi:hypothetical protein
MVSSCSLIISPTGVMLAVPDSPDISYSMI